MGQLRDCFWDNFHGGVLLLSGGAKFRMEFADQVNEGACDV
jgi:hypothetical protein